MHEFRKNIAAYKKMRDELEHEHRGRGILMTHMIGRRSTWAGFTTQGAA